MYHKHKTCFLKILFSLNFCGNLKRFQKSGCFAINGSPVAFFAFEGRVSCGSFIPMCISFTSFISDKRNMILPKWRNLRRLGTKSDTPWVLRHLGHPHPTVISILEKSTPKNLIPKIWIWKVQINSSKEFRIFGPNLIIEQYWNPED